MTLSRGELDGRAENPDAPIRIRRRRSRLAVNEQDAPN